MGTKNKILTVNAGSSSIKLDLFLVNDSGGIERALNAALTGIGQPGALLTVSRQGSEKQTHELEGANYRAAIDHLTQWLVATIPLAEIAAIGHRVVHGGPDHSQPELLTDDLERELSSLVDFDPGHAPAALRLISGMRRQFPDVPQLACFDTAFFHDLPRVAQQLALPRKYEARGLRRYGFHGLSYTYLLSAFGDIAGETAANGRAIFAHLGSGASLAATLGGKPVDTTMGFTPASGIMMSSRAGDLDPGIIGFLNRQGGMSIEEYDHMVNFESGLLGVSETSADMYTLLQNEASDERATEAVNLFVYQVKKSIGALAATLGGLDSLIFSGGIGEQSPLIRQRAVKGLGFLGIELDKVANQQQAELISAPHSGVGVHVIPTDEALVIARQAVEALNESS